MASITIIRIPNMPLIHKEIMAAAADGVDSAVQDSVSWIKNDVILGEQYVGDSIYPDIKPSTKKAKAKKGRTHVLIMTGDFKNGFKGESKGLKGTITGGGQGYAGNLLKRWKISELWQREHEKTVVKIVEDSIQKAVRF